MSFQELDELRNATLGHILMRSGRIMTDEALDKLHSKGLAEIRGRWIEVLRHVENGPIRQGVLAEKLRISKQATHKLVGELVDDGYLSVEVDPEDKRARLVSITKKGIQTWIKGLQEMKKLEVKLGTRLSPNKMERLRKLSLELLRVLENPEPL